MITFTASGKELVDNSVEVDVIISGVVLCLVVEIGASVVGSLGSPEVEVVAPGVELGLAVELSEQ